MALYKPLIGAEMSGSIGGVTASHNKGGQYFRSRVVPTDPGTAEQVTMRNAVAILAARWQSTLTQAQRDEWIIYAANVPLLNRLGELRPVSGLAQYIRSNAPRVQGGGGIVDDGPTTYSLATLNNVGITVTAAGSTADLFFDNTNDWANAELGRLYWYASMPKSPTINFFKGPYRFFHAIAGSATTPPVSPTSGIALPWPVAVGAKVFWQVRASNGDGRLSSPIRGSAVAA